MSLRSSSEVTLGLRFSGGKLRLQISAAAKASQLQAAIREKIGLTAEESFKVTRDERGKPGQVLRLAASATVRSLELKNGDVLYIVPEAGGRFAATDAPPTATDSGPATPATLSRAPSTVSTSTMASDAAEAEASPKVVEDAVDRVLYKKDGRIAREVGPHCQHSARALQKCLYCSPLEPYDSEYLKSQGVKHMSFHAYLRKLSGGVDKGKFAALEDMSCKIKRGCTTHKPWPAGICSKCQPSAVTLNSQPYRHVDNVMFENSGIVEQFLGYWRESGHQRLGFLYGTYEEFPEVPLGVKARVVAIYEPPQESTRDRVKLAPDENEARVEAMAAALGLRRVGWIFTDLLPTADGKVRHYRNIDSHFLSAQECIMAGYFQSRYPNACKHASAGVFGSKFVTVLVTGNKEHQIHMEGYQVSNQCMGLVRDDCLVPTKDAPELGYVRESRPERYVPDVFYKEKDTYGNEVTKLARPLPVEYLLIDVPVASPKDPEYFFKGPGSEAFPVENRPMESHLQDINSLRRHRELFAGEAALGDFFRDFHLLVYLVTQNVAPLHEHVAPMLEALRNGREDALLAWVKSEHWQTLELILQYS